MFILKNHTIGSRTLLAMTANNINNLGGRISANELTLDAKQDLNNIGGLIAAQDSLNIKAGRDINVVSTTQSAQNTAGASNFTRTNLDRVAGLYVTNPSGAGILVANAGNNINLNAAQIQNDSTHADSRTLIKAGNDINLGTVQIAEQNNSVRNPKNYLKHGSTQDIGTQIQTVGDITLIAGNDLNAKAATITSSEGALQGIAGNNITIENGEATSNMAAARTTKKRSGFSTTRTTTRDTYNDTTSIGSNLSADSINLVAGAQIAEDGAENSKVTVQKGTGDINITGSNVVATNDVNLNAGRDINITNATDTHEETHLNKVKKSGLSSSGASVTLGSSTLRTTSDSQTTTSVASTVGSIEGNVNINAGETYTQTGSDILTPAGDINITAQSVTIQNATDTSANQQTMKYKQSGITLAVTSPVISAIQTAQQMATAASQTADPRMQALAAGTAALAANNALDALGRVDQYGNVPTAGSTGPNDMTNVREANAADQVGGINVSISIGSSKASSSSQTTSTTVASSNLNAGGNINITATGAGQQSDINVIGSTIKAANNVSLTADNNINLQAAQNVDTLKGKNSGSSASIGVSFGTDGLLLTVGASGNVGKTKGNGSTWTETVVQGGNNAGNTVTLQSGTDTNIIGSQVIGNQIIANVGTRSTNSGQAGAGNLNIQSLQDINQYQDKQQSIGGSVSVGYGRMGGSFNYSESSIKSNYASVNEQAGLFAGDGGFQVNVAGNTNLTGGVMASSSEAVRQNLNSLTTQTLTISNIENTAEYSASSTSIGGGYSVSGDNVGFRNPNATDADILAPNMVGTNQQGQATTGGNATPNSFLPSLNGFSATAPVALSAADAADSTTVSGVSASNLNITRSDAQSALTGQDAATTVATLNRDVQTQLSTTTDAQGNAVTTAIAVDSQGNNVANTITPIYTEETKADIQAGFEIVGAFTGQVGTFLNNHAQETAAAVKAIENELKKPEDQQDINVITQAGKVLADNQTWAMGGTGRIALTAITAAFSGNITGSGANLIQHATVASLQALGAQQIKALAKSIGGESSVAHTALHAVLACAGAAATGGDCGTGALAASSGVVLNSLMNQLEGKDADKLTATEREARLNLLTTLVTGVTAAVGGDAAVANAAVRIETENNGLWEYVVFASKHPVALTNIGTANPHPETVKKPNISTVASTFQINLLGPGPEGSVSNAFRHAIWQAIIGSTFDEDVAIDAAYAHDPIWFGSNDSSKSSLNNADTTVDLLNNEIGRKVALDNPSRSNTQLAKIILDIQHQTGLYQAVLKSDQSYAVRKVKLDSVTYNNALQKLKTLDATGAGIKIQAARNLLP